MLGRGFSCGPWEFCMPFPPYGYERRNMSEEEWCEGVAIYLLSNMVRPDNGDFVPDSVVCANVDLARRYAKEMAVQTRLQRERESVEKKRKQRVESLKSEIKNHQSYAKHDETEFKQAKKMLAKSEKELAEIRSSMEGELKPVVKETMRGKLEALECQVKGDRGRVTKAKNRVKENEANLKQLCEQLEAAQADGEKEPEQVEAVAACTGG